MNLFCVRSYLFTLLTLLEYLILLLSSIVNCDELPLFYSAFWPRKTGGTPHNSQHFPHHRTPQRVGFRLIFIVGPVIRFTEWGHYLYYRQWPPRHSEFAEWQRKRGHFNRVKRRVASATMQKDGNIERQKKGTITLGRLRRNEKRDGIQMTCECGRIVLRKHIARYRETNEHFEIMRIKENQDPE